MLTEKCLQIHPTPSLPVYGCEEQQCGTQAVIAWPQSWPHWCRNNSTLPKAKDGCRFLTCTVVLILLKSFFQNLHGLTEWMHFECTHRCNVYLLSCLQQVAVKCIPGCIFVLRQNASSESLKLLFIFFPSLRKYPRMRLIWMPCKVSGVSIFQSLCVWNISQQSKKKNPSPVLLSYWVLASNRYHLRHMPR